MRDPAPHRPVMADEVIRFLRLKSGCRVLDATIGCGGHARFILDKIRPGGLLVGVDLDRKSLKTAKERLSEFSQICKLVHANFRDINKVLSELGIEKIDAALFDLGLSSYQIEDSARGFSFEREGFLDMRMDTRGSLRAYDIVNRYARKDLERIIRDFGQERYFRKITDFILERRKSAPINSTRELSDLIKKAVGRRYAAQRIHPATRTFQALRIAVNGELDNLEMGLVRVLGFLNPGARICVISFHSLEDRIVKMRFKEFEKGARGRIITKKPLLPASDEIRRNPRSRSAKLRVFEKTASNEKI